MFGEINSYCLLPIDYCLFIAYCLLTIAYWVIGSGWVSAWSSHFMIHGMPCHAYLLPTACLPTALCPDSVMPRQRYAFPALCLAATGGCLPKITTCPRNRKIGWFYNSLVFDQNTKENWKWVPPEKSKYSCKLPVKTNFLTNTWNDPMTHSFDLP